MRNPACLVEHAIRERWPRLRVWEQMGPEHLYAVLLPDGRILLSVDPRIVTAEWTGMLEYGPSWGDYGYTRTEGAFLSVLMLLGGAQPHRVPPIDAEPRITPRGKSILWRFVEARLAEEGLLDAMARDAEQRALPPSPNRQLDIGDRKC